ncbi:hypothetical protein M011DRAFT_402893 [Sporormia fimetaria CBS 119925]|uniref:protein-tyrosine-phosphatase n=1 Tax=Sporormia fimetaria CBS 119925 TaxID=1340428 RepID=A0A6A6VDU2_9PLEO|nr:hypothetical protein M011DRAFT_402893 [Sporormia fimetaria CBS 119925]
MTQDQAGARTPSPNYFGLHVDTNADVFASSAAQHIRANWSMPSSKVRSTAAESPRVIPVDQNPDFEAFKRQSENNRGFALGNFNFSTPSPSSSNQGFFAVPTKPASQTVTTPHTDADSFLKPRSPKRHLSTESALVTDGPRRESPASFLDQEGFGRTDAVAQFAEERHARPSLPPFRRVPSFSSSNRADTLPATPGGDGSGPQLITPQHVANILDSAAEEILLLDLRVSTQYAKSHISGALSLCIPTTLLKRASFTTQKLAETFKDDEQRERFESWRKSKYIIVYDASSSQLKDATTCVNTLKKFTTENWKGTSYIIKGGFADFSAKFPSWIEQGFSHSPMSPTDGLSIDAERPNAVPVIGGCPMPTTQNAANPFFGNIRQNMDLIGGVGQLSIKHPSAMTKSAEEELPSWLKGAADEKDHGKAVSDKFLHIEKREQKRMQQALSVNVTYGTPSHARDDPDKPVQVAGMEKGTKNRYNNIWPYEHSRVKLDGVAEGGCDYVNASHIQTRYSNKRYIATQGPLPATFNDFWNVVWQQDVRVIVMLTAETEGGQLKAHNYWSQKHYGTLFLNPLGEHRASLEPHRIHRRRDSTRPGLGQRRSTNPPKPSSLSREASSNSPTEQQPYVIVRKFTLSNSAEPFERMREITQLQYSHWPDFGAPAHPAHLLGLIEQCDAVVRQVNHSGSASRPDPPNGRPVLVHCSAGCGRTGTFCTVDSVIDMLKRQRQVRSTRAGTPMDMESSQPQDTGEANEANDEAAWTRRDDEDLIEKTVEDFRLQRLSMVQSLRQFVLCYESVLEWLVEQHPKSA